MIASAAVGGRAPGIFAAARIHDDVSAPPESDARDARRSKAADADAEKMGAKASSSSSPSSSASEPPE
jgi:hypothetical protein